MMEGTKQRIPTAGLILTAAAIFALLLALPGETITTGYINDLFIFLDGAHRISYGQVPNRDFHTALGPLTFYVPALGYWLSGTFGGAMPVGMGILTLALGPIVAHIASSRLRPVIALPFGIFVLLIVAVPVNLGESIGTLSFAMFYNRIGWAALGALLVMYLRPENRRPAQDWLDSICAALLTLLMLYTKITYGLVGIGFLVFMLFDRSQRRWAALSIGLIVVAGLLVEIVWRSTMAHLDDLMLTSKVSGTRNAVDLALTFLRHLADYVVLAILAALVLWRTRSIRDLLFFGYCAGPGLLIQNQNSQPWGIITIHAAAAVATEMLLRSREQPLHERKFTSPAAGSPFLLLALVVPTSIHCFLALSLHSTLAFTKSGETFGLPKFEQIRLAHLWSAGGYEFMSAYLKSIQDGARTLADLTGSHQNVSVLDFANPFSAGLGLPPPRGDNAWLHWNRNVSDDHFIPPEQLFRNVEILMQPKWGINNIPLYNLYGEYVRAVFEPVRESSGWIVWRRRDQKTLATWTH
jgi:hypothetical protein